MADREDAAVDGMETTGYDARTYRPLTQAEVPQLRESDNPMLATGQPRDRDVPTLWADFLTHTAY